MLPSQFRNVTQVVKRQGVLSFSHHPAATPWNRKEDDAILTENVHTLYLTQFQNHKNDEDSKTINNNISDLMMLATEL